LEVTHYSLPNAPTADTPQPIGRPKTVSDAYLDRLRELASQSPRQFGYAFERWTAQCLRQRLATEFDLEVSDRHIHRLLKQMGLSTRPNAANSNSPTAPRFAKIAIYDLNPANIGH
jgi:transposase